MKGMKLKTAILMACACCIAAYDTAASRVATEAWVTNKIAQAIEGGGAEIPEELSSITNAVKEYKGDGPPSPAMTYGWYLDGAANSAISATRLGHGQMIESIDLYPYEYPDGRLENRWASRSAMGPTNFLAYVSEIPAPSVPSAPEVTSALRWRADGTACIVAVAAGGTLTADTSNWTEGQAVMAIITLADGAGIEQGIELVGYGTWPVGTPFVACCYRIGLTVFVVPSTTL